MIKVPIKFICFLLALLLLAGCGGGTAAGSGEAEGPAEAVDAEPAGTALSRRTAADGVFSLNFDPEAGCNPIRAASAANMQFWSLLYDSVFTVDEDFNVSSEIVTGITTSDNVWWVFTVRTDVLFSDGTPLTARDVAYSIQRAQQTGYYGARLKSVYGVGALSDDTFAITASQANSQLPALLNIPIIKNGDYSEDWPLGSGPYMLDEAHGALVTNPLSRHAGEAPLEAVYLKDYMDAGERIAAFEESRIDIVTNDPTGMYNLGYGSSNETRYFDTTNLHFIGFNTRSYYFQSANTRSAVAYLVDRDYVADKLMRGCGVAAALPVHPRSALYDAEYAAGFDYGPEVAAALLRAAGVEDLDGDGELDFLVTGIVVKPRVRFIVNNDSAVKIAAARRLAEELNGLGVTTTLYELSWDDYMKALESGDYDMYYGELRLRADWDLSSLFRVPDLNARTVDWGQNYARIADESYAQLYGAYLAASEEERYDAFQEAARRVCDSAVLIPVCFERREVLTHRGVVAGMRPTQYDLFHGFLDWSINFE